jgi:hypothetical protein
VGTFWILGEAKSGKSELGEEIFHRLPGRKFYIGTLPRTPENTEQIRKHTERRPPDWELIEITDDLSLATRVIGCGGRDHVTTTRRGAPLPEGALKRTAVLLDGFGVYVEQRSRAWASKHRNLTVRGEMPFVTGVYREYVTLVGACGYLIVVDHVTADPPTPLDYGSDAARWRLRAVVTRCLASADMVIYHDREDVTHSDVGFVERAASRLAACPGETADRLRAEKAPPPGSGR